MDRFRINVYGGASAFEARSSNNADDEPEWVIVDPRPKIGTTLSWNLLVLRLGHGNVEKMKRSKLSEARVALLFSADGDVLRN